MWECRSCAHEGGEYGDAIRETLATMESVRLVSAEDALAACNSFTTEGLRSCGITF